MASPGASRPTARRGPHVRRTSPISKRRDPVYPIVLVLKGAASIALLHPGGRVGIGSLSSVRLSPGTQHQPHTSAAALGSLRTARLGRTPPIGLGPGQRRCRPGRRGGSVHELHSKSFPGVLHRRGGLPGVGWVGWARACRALTSAMCQIAARRLRRRVGVLTVRSRGRPTQRVAGWRTPRVGSRWMRSGLWALLTAARPSA